MEVMDWASSMMQTLGGCSLVMYQKGVVGPLVGKMPTKELYFCPRDDALQTIQIFDFTEEWYFLNIIYVLFC